MKQILTALVLAASFASLWAAPSAALDSVYLMYANKDNSSAFATLSRLAATARTPAQRFEVSLELGDYYLDKTRDYRRAESIYSALASGFPKHRLLPDVLYRLALAQEQQEKFLDAARNYEKVATRYSKSDYGQDALDAIERCFRKNYQDRVAYVNGFPITRIEIDDRISRNPTAYEPFERKLALLDTMVNTRLMYEAALAGGFADDPAFVFNLNEQRNRMLFQEWYEQEVNARSQPSERDLREAYRRDIAKYTTPERVQARQILVSTEEEASELRRLLTTDTTVKWDSIARMRSKAPDKDRGGDMGTFARGTQPKPVEEAAFRLGVGEISRPIPVQDGFVLIKVVKKTPRSVRKYDDVKNQISAELRQSRSSSIFEQQLASLKQRARVVQDSLALLENRDTLALVDGSVLTPGMLEERIAAIPPYFRGQFETPEGRKRILDQLILERLLVREVERKKLWLNNRVVDQLLSRRVTMLVDAYRQQTVSARAQPDSTALMAYYLSNIGDFREPTKAHVRELVTRSAADAERLRRWATNGRIPAMVSGRGLLTTDSSRAAALRSELIATANTDSLAASAAIAGLPAMLPDRPLLNIAGRNVADMARKADPVGPFVTDGLAGIAFNDITVDGTLYLPEIAHVHTPDQLNALVGPVSSIANDSARFGTYLRLRQPISGDFVRRLFRLDSTGVAPLQRVTGGWLAIKVVKSDTAQRVDFAELVRRYSTSGSKWSGGEMWLTRDDNSRDVRVVRAAYSLTPGALSPVIRLNDTTFTFLKLEDVKQAYTRPFAEVKGKIEPKLRRENEARIYQDLLASLRARARIEVIMKEEDFAPEQLLDTPAAPGQN